MSNVDEFSYNIPFSGRSSSFIMEPRVEVVEDMGIILHGKKDFFSNCPKIIELPLDWTLLDNRWLRNYYVRIVLVCKTFQCPFIARAVSCV